MLVNNNTTSNTPSIVDSQDTPNQQAMAALYQLQADAESNAPDAKLQADLAALQAIQGVTVHGSVSAGAFEGAIQSIISANEADPASKSYGDADIAKIANDFYVAVTG